MENTPQPSCISQGKNDAIELRKAIEYGFDMRHPNDCPSLCYWSSDKHGETCPNGGCVGMKIGPPVDPDFETHTVTNGRIKTINYAARVQAANELRDMLMRYATDLFQQHDDQGAQMIRHAAGLCFSWGQNERELQARLEKLHGRVEQV